MVMEELCGFIMCNGTLKNVVFSIFKAEPQMHYEQSEKAQTRGICRGAKEKMSWSNGLVMVSLQTL